MCFFNDTAQMLQLFGDVRVHQQSSAAGVVFCVGVMTNVPVSVVVKRSSHGVTNST
jgi:hypothetical protein